MRGADGSGRDGFIFRPAHEGKLAAWCVGAARRRAEGGARARAECRRARAAGTDRARVLRSKGMVASSGWAGERNAAGWFSKDLPVTQVGRGGERLCRRKCGTLTCTPPEQWEQARARKQHAAFTRLYEDGKRYQTREALAPRILQNTFLLT